MAVITPTTPGMEAKPDRAYSEIIGTTVLYRIIIDSIDTAYNGFYVKE